MSFDVNGFNRQVGLLLQRARKERHLTQAQLAERIGVPRASYASIESGRQRAAVDVVWRAAVAMGVPISQLVPEYQPTPTPVTLESGEATVGLSTGTRLSSLLKAREG